MIRGLAAGLAAALLALGLAAPAAGQLWRGEGRLTGIVLDLDERPIVGAEVRLELADTPGQGPPLTRTNKKGRWTLAGLTAARWRITISAEGYVRAEGWADTSDAGAPPIEVRLQPLEVVSPGFAENTATVVAWLEKGNSLLDQGQPAAARAEYEKALASLPLSERPEVLRAVARTHYLEKDLAAATAALKLALVIDSTDDTSRQLLLALSDGAGRGEEVRAWLARLDAEGAEGLGAELGLTDEPAYLLPLRLEDGDTPTLEPEAGRRGAYRVAFTERAPLSTLEVYAGRFQKDPAQIRAADPDAVAYDLAAESWEVVVPEGYDPGTPHGLFVWVSPTPSGRVAKPANLEALAARKLIWVAANNAGNPRASWDRIGLALDAVHNMKKLYRVDERRIYVGGYSGGGRITSSLVMVYPDVFTGGFSFFGCDFYRDVPVADKPGAHWPAAFPEPSREVKEGQRYVVLTGERDFNLAQTRIFHRLYQKEGFAHVHYLEIPGADHYFGIDGVWLGKGLDLLDE